ncbi:MAG: glycosyl hydrolase family 28-related protein [Paracoccaceae bacterium]
MTTNAYSPAPLYTISGIGPYDVPHDYVSSDELVVAVVVDEIAVTLAPADYTVVPTGPATSGTVFLAVGVASAHDGKTLTITRTTDVDQGWVSIGSTATGLETQLDQMARVIQEVQLDGDRSLRVLQATVAPYAPQHGRVPYWDDTLASFANGLNYAELVAGITAANEANSKADIAFNALSGGKWRADAAALIADTDLTYTPDQDGSVVTGTNVITQAEGFGFTVADAGASDHNLVTAGGVKLYVLPTSDGTYSVRAFGAVGDGVTDDTAAIQAAIDHCNANAATLQAPGGPYLVTTINVTCPLVGSINNRFSAGDTTFTSAVGAGEWAVVIDDLRGSIEQVTVRNTGAGNGIWAKRPSVKTALKDVSTSTTYTLVTGSGSIGVKYGTDTDPGAQAITATLQNVSARGYDICHFMSYYSNANTYQELYALHTNAGAAPASHGFKIDSRGNVFTGLQCESNFNISLEMTSLSYSNTLSQFWTEGTGIQEVIIGGSQNIVLNSIGSVGFINGSIPMSVKPGNLMIRPHPSELTLADFRRSSENLIRNASFRHGIGGLNWNIIGVGAPALGAVQVNGFNPVVLANPAGGTVYMDHVMSYIDLDLYPWLRGKHLTWAAFGKAESGVNMTIRAIVRNAGGSNLQYATSSPFSQTEFDVQKCVAAVPEDPADARYIVFRVWATGVPTGGAGKAGEIACPMVFLGEDLATMAPRPLTDGANTLYGTQTVQGGSWDQAHLVLGSNHLWIDATGKLRIKASAPTSDTDGTVVGAQS